MNAITKIKNNFLPRNKSTVTSGPGNVVGNNRLKKTTNLKLRP